MSVDRMAARPHFLSVRLSDKELQRYNNLIDVFTERDPFIEYEQTDSDLFRELIHVVAWMLQHKRIDLSLLPSVTQRMDEGIG